MLFSKIILQYINIVFLSWFLFEAVNIMQKSNYQKHIKLSLNKMINKFSFLWSEAAGINETSEKGTETYTIVILWLSVFSIVITFLMFMVTLNSDFSFILVHTIVVILLSFFLFTILANIKIFTEVVDSNSSLILIPAIILIETISYFFKILSLTIRISVNAATGHALTLIFFSLCCYVLEYIKTYSIKLVGILFYIICLIYLVMEIFISLLQIYVINLLAYYYKYENF